MKPIKLTAPTQKSGLFFQSRQGSLLYADILAFGAEGGDLGVGGEGVGVE